jgi:hypothetical protein
MMRKLCDSEIPSLRSHSSTIFSHVGFRALICKIQSKRKGGKSYFIAEELHDIMSRGRRNGSLQFMSPSDLAINFQVLI